MVELLRESTPILRVVTIGAYLAGVVLSILGVVLVSLGATGATEFSFFGQTFKSANVGIGAIFLGAALIVLLVRRALKSVDKVVHAEAMQVPGNQTKEAQEHGMKDDVDKALDSVPRVEVVSGKLLGKAGVARGPEGIKLVWRLDLSLYIEPLSTRIVVFPSHRCEAWVQTEQQKWVIDRVEFPVHTLYKSATIDRTENEAVIRGAGKLEIMARQYFDDTPISLGGWARTQVILRPAGNSGEITIDCRFEREGKHSFSLERSEVT